MKIAIVGSGIAGMGAAWLLNKKYDITLYEKNDYIGGHSNTREVNYDGVKIPVDTGFIVYNEPNYPNLKGLFKQLGVVVEKSNMSFSASIDNGKLEYCGTNIGTVFAQKRNIFNIRFLFMLRDILKFNRCAADIFDTSDEEISLGDYLNKLGVKEYFIKYYLLPMGGAIWSCPLSTMLKYPARTFIAFFRNHGLLTVADQPQWHTVSKGSREYVKKVTASYANKIKLNAKVSKITRQEGKVVVETESGDRQVFDHVVIAAHGDQALWMLKDATRDEKEILSNFHYQKNEVILHCDPNQMPRRKKVWASWNYMGEGDVMTNNNMSLTYWMNLLQNIDMKYPLFITMNPIKRINEDLIFDKIMYEHPIFDLAAIKSQEKIGKIQGINNTWFCGSYTRYGFHEDALMSAVNVANQLGVKAEWQ